MSSGAPQTAVTTPTGIDRSDADLSPTARIDGADQRVDVDVHVQASALSGSEPEAPDIEEVRALRHRTYISSRFNTFPVDVRGSSSTNSTSRGCL